MQTRMKKPATRTHEAIGPIVALGETLAASPIPDEKRTGAGPRSVSPGRARAYWACTLFVALTALGAGVLDILHLEPLFGVLLHLGYPAYFATLLGAWKILGAIVLVAPRYPLVKEWAYAGMVIDYSAAVTSHLASGDGPGAIVGPMISLAVLAASWSLRPQARRMTQG